MFGCGTDLYLNENDRFIPDMMVVCNRSAIRDDGDHGAPDLVVEVVSSSTADRDRVYRKMAYGKAGDREYWIVDPEKRFIEVYALKHGSLALNAEQSFSANTACDTPKDALRCSLYDDLTIRLHISSAGSGERVSGGCQALQKLSVSIWECPFPKFRKIFILRNYSDGHDISARLSPAQKYRSESLCSLQHTSC